jgi:Tfp pilus assembly protein PilZ
VQYCFDVNSEQKSWDITSIKNLSETGVCLQTGKPFEIGSTIALRFKIPSRPFDKTEINATVICCQSTGQGTTSIIRAEFKDLGDDIKAVLKEYVLWMVKNPVS